jgi:hypothetical protein
MSTENTTLSPTQSEAVYTEAQSLLEQLSQATTPPPPPPLPPVAMLQSGQSNMPTDFAPNSDDDFVDDFEPEPPPPDAPGVSNTGEVLVAVTYPPEKLAATLIDVTDVLLQAIMPPLYLKSLAADDAAALKILAKKIGKDFSTKDTITLTPGEQATLGMYQDFEDYKETLPLQADEKKTILAPLKEVLKDAKYETTPTTALLMAVGVVMLPRALPILGNRMANK